ncbi:MAG TPA: TIGR03617 family F420-dependent LLM class oxidoreductase [Candidatus Limnocylindria bacterium]|nr:TIGR03617 family F420-dependent LLM class oxidoreductase [Candidatus Limnocylindria bacterium]
MRLDAAVDADLPLREAATVARRAEAAGIAGLWTTEIKHDPFLPLVAAASATERIELGTAVAVAFARSPLVTAATAWDLARASGGRFILGLGSQVRAHVVRRFGMPWSGRPVAQMREYVTVVRAAWSAWLTGTPPSFRGETYRFTLMTPFFDPGPIEHPEIPIYLAAVGPGMVRLAGEVADGLVIHPLHSRAYLEDVILPTIATAATDAGREASAMRLSASVIVATDDDEIADARRTIGFYASTPTYRGLLDHHGWGAEADALANHARHGRWDEMASVVTDAMVDAFAVVSPPADLRSALERHADGLIDRVAPYPPFGSGPWQALLP